MKTIYLFVVILAVLASCKNDPEKGSWIISAPAGEQYVSIDKNGQTIIPNGRIIKPAGKSIVVAPHPYGLALSPDGNTARSLPIRG